MHGNYYYYYYQGRNLGGATDTIAPPETRLGGAKHPLNFEKDRNCAYGWAKVFLVFIFFIYYVLSYMLKILPYMIIDHKKIV